MSPNIEPIPFGACNCSTLRKASRHLSQLYDAALAPSGLKSTQAAILMEVERRKDDPPTMHDLAKALVLEQSTVGQNLRPLERDGLIALKQDAADRRRRHVTVTEAGRAKLAMVLPLWAGAQKRFEDFLGSKEAAELRATMLKVAYEFSPASEDDSG